MNIAVIGTGYVGLVTGTCFAETGNHVICVDVDADKVQRLRAGEIPIYEPGLQPLFERNTKQQRLQFTTDLAAAVPSAEIVFLALPTPPGEDGSADLSYILGVAGQLATLIKDYKVIVHKSTVPVGTGEQVAEILGQTLEPHRFDVVSNPEFLREGAAISDFLKPDRVIVGTDSQRAQQKMRQLYAPFVRQGNPILFMDRRSAEMTKYAANAYLATRITFMNEVANLCERVGADVDFVRRGIGADHRIGKRFLFPGIGYGGSCFPKDVKALDKIATDADYPFQLLQSVMRVNKRQKRLLVDKLEAYFDDSLAGRKIAVWGVAFKPNTDDIREAPSLNIIEELLDRRVEIRAFDPEAMDNLRRHFGDRITYCENQYEAVRDADALTILTEWSVFRTPDFDKVKSLMARPVIFDGRNVYDLPQMEDQGFYYQSIGRRTVCNG